LQFVSGSLPIVELHYATSKFVVDLSFETVVDHLIELQCKSAATIELDHHLIQPVDPTSLAIPRTRKNVAQHDPT